MTGSESVESLKKDIEDILEKYSPNHPLKNFLTFELMCAVERMLVGYLQSTSKPKGEA